MPCEFFIKNAQRTRCQFNIGEGSLISLSDGRRACQFHAPLQDTNGNGTEKAKWNEGGNKNFNGEVGNQIRNAGRKKVDLSGVVFPVEIKFSDCECRPDFEQATFHKAVVFRGVSFPEESSFKKTNFLDAVDFQYSKFASTTSFVSAKFSGASNFSNTVFTKDADFTGLKFKNKTSFTETTFEDKATFEKTVFAKEASFDRTKFIGDADFVGSQFNSEVDFANTIFTKNANFFNTVFKGSLKFTEVQFEGPANFNVDDEGLPSSFPELDFSNSTFKDSVSFINRKFLTTSNFDECVFFVAPEFQGCTLHQDTKFPQGRNFKDHSPDAAPAYRTLKLDMENSRARQEEAMFYALEQKCQAADSKTDCVVKRFSRLYELTSNYGQSLGRPVASMSGVSVSFFLIYLLMATGFSWKTLASIEFSWKTLGPTIGFTIEQSVSPFKVWRLPVSPEWLSSGVDLVVLKIIATLHSSLFLVFFGLFILVLRWRFKRG